MILILYIFLLIGLLLGFQWLKYKRVEWKQIRDFKKVFRNSQIELPKLEVGSSYSWATFDITFRSKQDLEFAERSGLIEQFKKKIRTYYDQEFDPDRAIYCTYVGHVPSWQVMLDDEIARKKGDNQ